MKAHKPINFRPITDALDALRASVEASLPPVSAITYKARSWDWDSAIDEDGDKHESVASYVEAYAFQADNLGGGVMAYSIERDNADGVGESYVTITSKDDTLPDNFLSWVNVGVYRRDDSGSSYVCRGDLPVCEAVHWAMHVPTPASGSHRYVDERGMPKVGECYWIHQPIERYPHFICHAHQYATVTYVDAETFNIRPATPVEWDESDEATWGTVQFSLPNGGLEEFHEACALASTRAKYMAEEPPVLTVEDEERLAHDALDVAARHIQDRLGVTTGDAAGMFFAGLEVNVATDIDRTYEDRVIFIMREYIAMERGLKDAESK